MIRNIRIWLKCPEIRSQILLYWTLYLAQGLTLLIFSPLIIFVILFAVFGNVLHWLAEILHVPYNLIIEFLEDRRSESIKHAHSIISVDQIRERIDNKEE